ncbi:hypothetical protein JF535_02500 [Microbulbifer salipaludis]|uniref:LVIVD repeat-containing protein n=1 Tax=Microbulbifer salipaludis TaxID=187980 RepID=A0ABS3E346_9GAMM|nr:hypothetical protein [Microbulbifer salipaludis]MBN8429715.1 hypothetical protein [Microbulbifer salipaludis]
MNLKRTLGVVVASCILSACGGGGGSDGGSAPSPSPTPTQYSVTTSVGTGGSVSPQSATVESGGTATFTISADQGYQISSVEGCNGTLSDGSYTTGQITANCVVTIAFAQSDSTSTDSQPPTASILFPAPVTRTSSNTLIVRGTARDAGSVKSVRVNGVEATLTRSSAVSLQNSMSIHRYVPDPLANGTGGGSDEDSEDEVEWEAEISVPDDDDSTVVVETEDDSGNVEEVADTVEIKNRAVPVSFTIDAENRKLMGQLWQLPSDDGWYNPLVIWGLDDDSYEILSTPADYPYCGMLMLDSSRRQVICPELFDGHLKLTALNLDSSAHTVLLGKSLELDPAEWQFAHVTDAKLSADYTSIYLMLTYFSVASYDDNKVVIFRYDFADNSLNLLVDGYTPSGVKLAARSFDLTESGIVAIKYRTAEEIADEGRLILIDYAGTDVTDLTEPVELALDKVDIDGATSTAYMAGYYGIAKADLTDGSHQVLSLESDEKLFNVNQLASLAHDAAASRLLVGDSAYGYIFAVDTETGERTEFAANGVGSGKHLLAIRAIELDEDAQTAYVLDDGGSEEGILAVVDLNTGNREEIARLPTCRYFAQDLVLDKSAGRIFAVFEHEIFEVTLADGLVRPLISSGGGSCGGSYTFSGGSLDVSGSRLLLTETSTDSILALDLASATISSVYSGGEIDVPVDVEPDPNSGLMYVLSQANGALYSYDQSSNELSLLLDECIEDHGRNALDPNIGNIHGMDVDPNNPWIWISGDYLMKFDLEANSCAVMPWKYYGYGLGNNISILDAEAAADGRLFGTKFNNVIQIDFESGEIVTISR